MPKRTIIIGDLHGMYDEACRLLDGLDVLSSDRVILLGDLVDRGPHSGKCVDLAMELERCQGQPACILGNHEDRHLSYREVERRKGRVIVNVDEHIKTRSQLVSAHYDYMRRLPKYIRLPEYGAVCVHAGVWPGRAIEQQLDHHLLHIQVIRPIDEAGQATVGEKSVWSSKVPPGETGWGFWSTFWTGPERIIFGHSVLNMPLVTDKAVGLDGGACFGMELWALVLPTWEVIRLSCADSGRKGRNTRKMYAIGGGVGTY